MPKTTVDEELKKRFLAVFRDSGLTQEDFGRRIGQKQHAVSQVLRGPREPSKAMLKAVITEFDISPEWLYFGTGGGPRGKAPGQAEITTEVFWTEIGKLKGQIETLGEALRALQLQGQPQLHPTGQRR